MRIKFIISLVISVMLFWNKSLLSSQQQAKTPKSNSSKPAISNATPAATPPSTIPSSPTPAAVPISTTDLSSSPPSSATPATPINIQPSSPDPETKEPSPTKPSSPPSTSATPSEGNPQSDNDPSSINNSDATPAEKPKSPYDPNLEELWNCKYNQKFPLDKCIEIQSFFCSRCSRLNCAILENRAICLDICDPRHPLMQPCVQAGKMNIRKLPALPPDPKLVQQMIMQQQQLMMQQQIIALGAGAAAAGIGAAAKGIGGLFKKK